MSAAFLRAWHAFTFRADFRLSHWKVSQKEARSWLIAAAVANVIAQVFVAHPGAVIWNSLGGLVTTAVLWYIPARLSAAAGGLLVVQAIGSVVVIVAAHLIRLPGALIETLAWLWSIYGTVALAALALKYFQTPKTQMP